MAFVVARRAGGRRLSFSVHGYVNGICRLTLACGLYYLAEFIEEYSTLSLKIIRNTIWVRSELAAELLTLLRQMVMGWHVVLMVFESTLLSFWQLALSLGCHCVYYQLLSTFPFIQLTDPIFILSCGTLASNAGTIHA